MCVITSKLTFYLSRTYVGGWVLSPLDYRRKDQSRVNVLNIKGKFAVVDVVVLFFVCLACECVWDEVQRGAAIVGFVNKTKQLCNMGLYIYIYIYI